jgi:SMODS-associating 2TM, beta-strand rich effector domain
MLSELRVWSLVAVTGAIWLTLAVVGIVTSNFGALSTIADLFPLVLLLAYAFERRGWRWQPLHPRLVSTPVLIGTWKGQLESYWEDSDGKTRPPKTVYLVVRQTLTTVSVRLLTDEATSEQIAGGMAKTDGAYPAIAYNYRSTPEIALRHASSDIHFGGAVIEIVGDPATELRGEYWNERKGTGRLRFREHTVIRAQTYEQATALSYQRPRPVGMFD